MNRQKRAVVMLLEARQYSLQGRLGIADRTDRDRVASAEVGGIGIYLDDRRVVWIELPPGKVCAEQQQHIAVEDRAIAGPPADDTGHPDIVRVVVFDKVLAARG